MRIPVLAVPRSSATRSAATPPTGSDSVTLRLYATGTVLVTVVHLGI